MSIHWCSTAQVQVNATPAWALFDQVVVGDQLIAINGIPVKSAEEIHTILQGSFSR